MSIPWTWACSVLSMHAPFEVVSKLDVYMAHKAFSALMNRGE